MSRLNKSFLFLLLSVFFALSGVGYFYAPDAVLTFDVEPNIDARLFVYYTTNEHADFSDMQVCMTSCNRETNLMTVHIPAERICRIRLVPYDWNKRSTHGHYVKGPIPSGAGTYALVNPRLSDASGVSVGTEDFVHVTSGGNLPANAPCFLNNRVEETSATFEVKREVLFGKQFDVVRFAQVSACALLCAWLVMLALYAEPFLGASRKRHFRYALVSALACTMRFDMVPSFGVLSGCEWLSYLLHSWQDCQFMPVLMCVPFYALYRKAGALLKNEQACSKAAKGLAVLFALFLLVGKSYHTIGSSRLIWGFEYAQGIKAAVCFLGLVVLLYSLILLFFHVCETKSCRLFAGTEEASLVQSRRSLLARYFSGMARCPFATTFISLILFFIPFLALKYPCSMSWDGYTQALQYFVGEHISDAVVGPKSFDVVMNAHHPLLHTLLVLGAMKCGVWLGNLYAGLFLYSCMQLLVVALSVAFSVHVLVRCAHLRAPYASLIVAYFLLHPYMHDAMFNVIKDTLYSSAILVYLSLMFVFLRDHQVKDKNGMASKWYFYILMAVSAVGIVAFRHEGILILMAATVTGLMLNVKTAKPLCVAAVAALAAVCCISCLSRSLDVQPGEKIEKFSVPCQQLARALAEHEERFTPEEKQSVSEMFGGQDIARLYSTGVSDIVKVEFREDAEGENLRMFFEMWGKGLVRCPQTYVDAFLHNYYLYFYPDIKVVSQSGHVSIYATDLGARLGNPRGASYLQLSEKLHSKVRKYSEEILSLAVVNVPFLAATYTWVLCLLLAYVARHTSRNGMSLLLFPLFLFLLTYLGPTNGDYGRYCYPRMILLPFLFIAVIWLIHHHSAKYNG